jgi:hypothetical protein
MARREGARLRGDFVSSGHDRRLTPVVAFSDATGV